MTTKRAVDIINEAVESLPINKAQLARQVGMSPEILRRSLGGKRKLRADEFIDLAIALGIDAGDLASRSRN